MVSNSADLVCNPVPPRDLRLCRCKRFNSSSLAPFFDDVATGPVFLPTQIFSLSVICKTQAFVPTSARVFKFSEPVAESLIFPLDTTCSATSIYLTLLCQVLIGNHILQTSLQVPDVLDGKHECRSLISLRLQHRTATHHTCSWTD
jgi:hypothetical protein